jgi:hypothetical protein
MQIKQLFQALAVAIVVVLPAQAGVLADVHVDEAGRVHLLTSAGKHLRLAGPAANAQLAPDGDSAAWIVPGAGELRLYRHGKTRAIKCEPVIRDFWFWKNGSRIAIDCGGSHFAGREILYDSATLKQLESFDQATVPTEKRPEWSSSSDRYRAD